MIYVCTARPYPSVQVQNPTANAVFAFGGGGRIDTMEMAKVRHLPYEWIDEAIEAMPEFQGKGKDRKGRTVFRMDEIEPPIPPEDPDGKGKSDPPAG